MIMENFQKCTKLVSTLKSSQSLLKCPRCFHLAVVEKNIGQCQNVLCQYIWCRNCSSFSATGPEDFYDKCQKSELVLEAPAVRQRLLDISNATATTNVNTDTMPSFFMDSSPGPLHLNTSKYDSSGYMSENDLGSPAVRRNTSTALTGKDKSNILKDCNRNSSSSLRRSRRSSLLSVVESNTPKIVETVEPSSPPKVKNVACSRQSKKNLKRLKF
ncbi:uncharacterized protein LOC112905649 [Agrilus planipennis]|uniref:Uncharacterized protein LOC112905649 n=1 Tax=Agrilus planipennis TaxID=224129 RepID=A0A7F5RE88_AGRPL|nr:uncharacterized protein LOC112905649 [Agrilus planipennis]